MKNKSNIPTKQINTGLIKRASASIFLFALVAGSLLISAAQANDINSSWSVNTLKAQALTHTVKQAVLKKYTQPRLQLKQPPQKQMKTNKELQFNKTLIDPD